MRPAYARVGPPAEWPARPAVAVAAFCGIVLGALGGGILGGAGLASLILITFGVWRAVAYLAVLVDAVSPDLTGERHETVRVRR